MRRTTEKQLKLVKKYVYDFIRNSNEKDIIPTKLDILEYINKVFGKNQISEFKVKKALTDLRYLGIIEFIKKKHGWMCCNSSEYIVNSDFDYLLHNEKLEDDKNNKDNEDKDEVLRKILTKLDDFEKRIDLIEAKFRVVSSTFSTYI